MCVGGQALVDGWEALVVHGQRVAGGLEPCILSRTSAGAPLSGARPRRACVPGVLGLGLRGMSLSCTVLWYSPVAGCNGF